MQRLRGEHNIRVFCRDYRFQVYKYMHVTWPDLHPYKVKSLLFTCKNLQLHVKYVFNRCFVLIYFKYAKLQQEKV